MREQRLEDSSGQQSQPQGEKSAPGNTQQKQGQEYLSVATRKKNVRKTTYLLAVLFAAGLLCLLLMIKKSTPQKAAADTADSAQTQIEVAIARLTGIKSEIFKKVDGIVSKFYEFSNIQQVKVNELAKNPFERDIFLGKLVENSDNEKDQEISPEFIKQQKIRQQAEDLQLLSVIQSEQGNCCMIDDKILYEGDSINGFKVTRISNNSVSLKWEQEQSNDIKIILRLSQ